MIKKTILILAVLVSLLGVYGCDKPYTDISEKENVSAVFYHDLNKFSVAVSNGEELRFIRMIFPVSIVIDAKESAWYECQGKTRSWDGATKESFCNIHLRSIDDLVGGEWDNGKFGRGKTIRIN